MDHLEYSTSSSKKALEVQKIMTSPETIRKVRLDRKKGNSHRSIAKGRGVDRKTVNVILKSDKVKFSYSNRSKQVFPKLENFKEKLNEMLESEITLPKKKRSKFTRIFERIIEAGYQGGYDSVRRYCTSWLKENDGLVARTGCVPMEFKAGDAFQFDWTPEHVVLNGVLTPIKVGVMTLCHSRMSYVRAYTKETTEMLLDFHVKAFNFFGGSCERGVYDNMKTAVKKILSGKEREWQRKMILLSSHYLFELEACTPRKPQEKGIVERRVQSVQEDSFRPTPKYSDLNELNENLEEECLKRARTRPHPELKDKSVWEIFLEEQKSLIPVSHDFDGYIEKQCCISKTQLVQYDKNRYSLPVFNPKIVDLRIYAERLVFLQNGKIIAEHQRVFGRDQVITHFEHYLKALSQKPGAIRDGIPFQDERLPSAMVAIRHRMKESYEDADRQFVDILCAVRDFGIDDVNSACELALESSLISKDVVLNILYRTKQCPQSEALDEPEHLKLSTPPSDDCSEYNLLLAGTNHE